MGFVSKTGRQLTAQYLKSSNAIHYFTLNDTPTIFRLGTHKGEKCLEADYNFTPFFASLGLKSQAKTNHVTINVDAATYDKLFKIATDAVVEAEKAKTDYLASQPIHYRVRFDGLWADGDLITTKVIFEEYKKEQNGSFCITQSATYNSNNIERPIAEYATAQGLSAFDSRGWFSLTPNAEQYAAMLGIATGEAEKVAAAKAEKVASAEAKKAEIFAEAKRTGTPQLLKRSTGISSGRDSETYHTYSEYAMPDGTTKGGGSNLIME